MSGRVAGKVAVVTGSSGGMGEGIARLLAQEGAAVVISGRRGERCQLVADEINASGGRAIAGNRDGKGAESYGNRRRGTARKSRRARGDDPQAPARRTP